MWWVGHSLIDVRRNRRRSASPVRDRQPARQLTLRAAFASVAASRTHRRCSRHGGCCGALLWCLVVVGYRAVP